MYRLSCALRQEPHQQVHRRRLTSARRPHQRDSLAALHLQVDAAQHGLVAALNTGLEACSAPVVARIDVAIGTTIAYLILRTRLPGRQWLDFIASAAIAVPGIVLAIGYLRTFQGLQVAGVPVTQTWILIMIAYAVRRLPYALRSCMAALQQINVSLEEAAEMLGASKWRTVATMPRTDSLSGRTTVWFSRFSPSARRVCF